MKKFIYTSALATLAVITSSCAEQSNLQTPSTSVEKIILNTDPTPYYWRLEKASFGKEKTATLSEADPITLIFLPRSSIKDKMGKISGISSINRYFATYQFTPPTTWKLVETPATTKIAGSESAMQLESDYLEALTKVDTITMPLTDTILLENKQAHIQLFFIKMTKENK